MLSLLAVLVPKYKILTPEELLAAKLLAEAAHATWREYSGTQFSRFTGTKVQILDLPRRRRGVAPVF